VTVDRRPLAVLPCPLEDDFDVHADEERVLERLTLHVLDASGAADPAVREAEILITGISTQTVSGREIADAMPRLRWIQSMTAGVNDVVSASLLERDVLVTSTAGAYALAIAEYAFAAMVMLTRGLPELVVAKERRAWAEDHPLGGELAGKCVGIIGFGGIGTALARHCTAAGMSVWALRRRAAAPAGSPPIERLLTPAELPHLLEASDFVVVAASLNPSSLGLIGAAELERMKPGAFLVNIGRGELVDETALVGALGSGRIAGAMVDVTAVEPLPGDNPLWALPNLWITPHMAGGTRESRTRALTLLLENIGHYLDGHAAAMRNIVDLRHELGLIPRGERC